MSWIKWCRGLEGKPETLAIASTTGLDRFAVAGRLMVVWAWADEVTRDGRVLGDVRGFVDELVARTGFANAMCDAGWLRVTDGVTLFPKFRRHNLETAKERALAAGRSARYRERRRHGGSVTNHVSTRPNPTKPDPTPDKTQPECAGTGGRRAASDDVRPGPGRADQYDTSGDRHWLSYSAMMLAEGLGLSGEDAVRQRRSLRAVCKAIASRRHDRVELVKRMIAWATEIRRDANVDAKVPCWQARVNKLYDELGIPRRRRPSANVSCQALSETRTPSASMAACA